MIRHYATLSLVARKMKVLIGRRIADFYSAEKFTAVLDVEGLATSLILSVHPMYTAIYSRTFSRSRKNTLSLFPNLIGASIIDVCKDPSDRIIRINTNCGEIWVLLYSGPNANILLVQDRIVGDALRKKKDSIGKPFSPKAITARTWIEAVPSDLLMLSVSKDSRIMSRPYAEHILDTCNLTTDVTVRHLNAVERERIELAIVSVRDDLSTATKAYLYTGADVPLLSLIRFHGKPPDMESDDVLDLISRTISARRKKAGLTAKKTGLLNVLDRERVLLQRRLERLSEGHEHAGRADQYRVIANLLLAQENPRMRGLSELPTNDETTAPIRLDPALTVIENADKYYQKAGLADRKLNQLQMQLERTRDNLQTTLMAIQSTEVATSADDLTAIEAKLNLSPKALRTAPSPYRRYQLSASAELLVGKNAASNDELITREARPNDIWLHARGIAGAHGIIRIPNRKGVPSKETIMKAAEIIAWFSSAKKSDMVPVSYTRRNNVRKVKGVPGMVRLTREEVILVTPHEPPSTD